MKVLVTQAETSEEPLTFFRQRAAQDRFRVHSCTDDPEEADIILFAENGTYEAGQFFDALRHHPWRRQYRDKVFMYNEHDRPWCLLPGVYASMPRPFFNRSRQRAYCYMRVWNPYIGSISRQVSDPDILFSFAGSRNCRVREAIFRLEHPRARLNDTSNFYVYHPSPNVSKREAYLREYAETLGRSKFVLCPRGNGTASSRLFETMEAGRVPVILSDDYVFPDGPLWEEFAIILPESQASALPHLLEEREAEAETMGCKARSAWEEWFARDVAFHRVVEACADILQSRKLPEAVACLTPEPLYPYYRLRHYVSTAKTRVPLKRSN